PEQVRSYYVHIRVLFADPSLGHILSRDVRLHLENAHVLGTPPGRGSLPAHSTPRYPDPYHYDALLRLVAERPGSVEATGLYEPCDGRAPPQLDGSRCDIAGLLLEYLVP